VRSFGYVEVAQIGVGALYLRRGRWSHRSAGRHTHWSFYTYADNRIYGWHRIFHCHSPRALNNNRRITNLYDCFAPGLFLQSLDVEIGGHDFSLANVSIIIPRSVTLFNGNLVEMSYVGVIFETNKSFQLFLAGSLYTYSELPTAGNDASGTITVSPATVPLPSTLPLFVTGLGAFGLLSSRRKRKLNVH
jgi:hypothetical protein